MDQTKATCMVASSQKLATEVGLEMMKSSGNAVDAAIAVAALLVLTEPTCNGLGGDAFAIVHDRGKITGLNASGRAPGRLSAELLREKGFPKIPNFGWEAVTVPGQVAGWCKLHARFGRMPLAEVLAPAIHYSETGIEVGPKTALFWQWAAVSPRKDFACFRETFLPGGEAPRAGQQFKNPALGRSLKILANRGHQGFYHDLAEEIVAHSNATGGYFTMSDFSECQAEFVEPIRARYRGVEVLELPPNGQGIAALMALKMTEQLNFARGDEGFRHHGLVESMRLAFADTYAHVGDPSEMKMPMKALLDDDFLRRRALLIQTEARLEKIKPGLPTDAGTVYFCTADRDGMMVSFIQSNYWGFGSGIVIPKTGISMQNRGCGFSLDPEHPNFLKPGKRPFHTIMPGFLMKNSRALGPFGIMGGDMQPQAHLQVVSHLVDRDMSPQQALNRPRIRITADDRLSCETGLESEIIMHLQRLGHDIDVPTQFTGEFGSGQIILRSEQDGRLSGGSDPRSDGCALGIAL